MKSVKIILGVSVLAIIVFFVLKWFVDIDKPPPPPLPINQQTEFIETEIDSLKKIPDNVFCQNFYLEIQACINDYHNDKTLGDSKSDNDQWKEILSKNLYSAYAPKFAEQAMSVFTHSEWNSANLSFIRSEERTLQSSSYLDASSPVASSFKTIREILAKYDEITGFISTCNSFSYSSLGLNDHFPDVSDKISKSRTYLENDLDNIYVNNCTRLKNELIQIPKNLFDIHISYLSQKINYYGGRYTEYRFQSDYSSNIYTPLRDQVYELNNEMYHIDDTDFNDGYYELGEALKKYNSQAYDYYKTKKSKQPN